MKAIVFDRFGKAEVLRLAEVPKPEMRPGDLLVKVKAAGVNRADLLQREGYYGTQSYGESDLLGLELAGEIVAVGKEVTGFCPGERVMAIVGGGAYAEFARVDHGMAVHVPERLDDVAAGAVMESFVTAWEAVAHLGAVTQGSTVLVHAAAGGVGSAAVEIAHALGSRVFATASGSRRSDVGALGADQVFDYRSEDFKTGVLDATHGKGVDVVIDFVGGDYLARNLASLTPGGRLIQVGLMSGEDDATIPLGLVLHNHLHLIGTVMKSRNAEEKRAMIHRFAMGALPMFVDGRLHPVVGRTFPLADAAGAHRFMEAGGGFGKIVLTVPA
ncbi:NAD(P)H-quinone oxidoreductase [Desulfovibrio sp. TomC]|uniref:NAD(P)H-quinone oxidoreductase n=1 Tax=Desulfovibrio sp. TomC TaxID=1562888 RepID=UPI00057332BA|nr:NAD(P)H-quinone oxidoreductase [Desulfovibrio sp. TomC]KHK03107.1 Quinone oxidoreductase [Desulfovibrio sp. TomC]